jgi:hypothetical protein
VSDAHKGTNATVAKVLDAFWQSCRVHFMRNALAHAGKSGRRVVSAFIAAAFAQDDAEAAGMLEAKAGFRRLKACRLSGERWPSTTLDVLRRRDSLTDLPMPLARATVRWSPETCRTTDSCLGPRAVDRPGLASTALHR